MKFEIKSKPKRMETNLLLLRAALIVSNCNTEIER